MDDLLGEFLTETNEGLQVLDTELVKLEQDPSPELLDNIFRVMHTIKGTCGFLGLPRLEAVAHSGETVLGKIRDGELVVTPTRVSLILECLDRIREILGKLEETEAEPEGDDSELIAKLDAVSEMADYPDAQVPESGTEAGAQIGAESAPAAQAPAEPEPVDELEEIFRNAPGPQDLPESAQPKDPGAMGASADAAPVDAGAGSGQPAQAERQSAAPAQAKAADSKPADGKPAEAKADAKPAERETPRESQVASQSIRVSVDLLESLMTTVSELVLNRNQLLQILRSQQESEFSAPLQRLNHVVSELQEGVMKTRMQPIGNAWSKLPRIVRDLSQELDKKIELKMKGEETELDRQVLELIKVP